MLALVSLLAVLLVAQATAKPTVFSVNSGLFLNRCVSNRDVLPMYSKFELTLDLAATYDNPFDPNDIDVRGVFTSPARKIVHVNGFLYQEYKRELTDRRQEQLTPVGAPVWKIRFAPDSVGTWSYVVSAKDRNSSIQQKRQEFKVVSGSDPGFVGVSKRSPGMFAFAGEKPFFAVGENMCWAGPRGTYDFDKWLSELSGAGGNWIRIWMNNSNTTLEAMPDAGQTQSQTAGYHGLGMYSLDHAWKLDQILNEAESKGIYSMICFGTYGEFKTGGYFNEGQWPVNPYNAANGGPCKAPDEFWTSAEARSKYKQRLRYIMARFGYRTHIQAWEFWNESDAPVSWVGEMSDFLKGIGSGNPADPYRHLISTTYGNDAVWKLPGIDFTMTHSYGTGNIADHAPMVYDDAIANAKYHKPHLMAEFGIDWRAPDTKYDPDGTGINLHNGLWAGLASGDAGGAMLWWWDNYISPLQIYKPFAAVRKFADTIAWTSGPWMPASFDAPKSLGAAETFSDLTIPALLGWGKSNNTHFTITPHGVRDHLPISQFFYSPSKPDLRTVPSFQVQFEERGRFTVHVNTVSASCKLQFSMDGKSVKEFVLSASPPVDKSAKPEYQSTAFMKEYNIYQAVFNRDYGIDVPAGAHTITIDNVDGDWASIDSITLSSYRSSRYPDINLYGIVNHEGGEAILWIQNAGHNWKNAYEKKPMPAIEESESVLHGLNVGGYTVEWWDTDAGSVMRRNSANVGRNGDLALKIPRLKTDVAVRIAPTSRN